MSKRKSKVLHRDVTQAQFEEAMNSYATAHAKHESITTKMDVQIAKIREKFQSELNDLAETQESNYEVVQTYCEENPELFAKKKSMDTVNGTVGFRSGTPKIKLLKGYTWAVVMKLLKSTLPTYVRTVEEPNKEKLLADRNAPEVAAQFKEVGIMVDSDERFYIELKKEAEAAIA